MTSLNILGGGAAQGLVGILAPEFKRRTRFDIAGEFGAVGAMADKLRGGTPSDIVILTDALVERLAEEKLVVRASIAGVGLVETSLAVRCGDPLVVAKDSADLRQALLASDAIFVPDTKASTAGIHVTKILEQLGIADDVARRLNIHPNGATAMKHLAASNAERPIGCTQATEIISTPGIALSGPLPPGLQLATMYTAAVTTRAVYAAQAQALIELLTSADQDKLRQHAGFRARTAGNRSGLELR